MWHSRCKSSHTRVGVGRKQSTWQLASSHCPAAWLLRLPTSMLGQGITLTAHRQWPHHRQCARTFQRRAVCSAVREPEAEKRGQKPWFFSPFSQGSVSMCPARSTMSQTTNTQLFLLLGCIQPSCEDSHLKTSSREDNCAGQMVRHQV